MRFKDQGALVTGAGSGIGRETAHAFAAEGAHVAVADIDLKMAERSVEEIRKQGGSAHAFSLDVTDQKAVAGFIDAAVNRLGRIDVLVNSAGVREIKPVLELPLEEWQPRHRREYHRCIPVLAGLRSPSGPSRQARSDRQSCLDPWRRCRTASRGLHRLQARRGRPDKGDGDGAGRQAASASTLSGQVSSARPSPSATSRTRILRRGFATSMPWALGRAARDRQSHPIPRVGRGELRDRHNFADRRRLDGRQAAVAGNAPRAASEA